MPLVVPNSAEQDMLEAFLNKTAPENLVLKLFTNNVTPGETDTAGTYTEASGSGYASIALTAASWTVTPGAPTQAAYPQQTFTFSGALGNVYGYFIVGATSGKIKFAERFTSAPYNIANVGDQIKVSLQITLE